MPLVLTAADVRAVFDMPAAIESQRVAFEALGRGTAQLAPRVLLQGDESVSFCYVSRLSSSSGAVSKFGNVNAGNAARGLPSVSALVIVQDPVDGTPAAIIEGESVTTFRTPAGSAVAVDHLAPPDAGDLAVIGCGVQGRAHVQALAEVRTLKRVRMYARREDQRTAAAADLGASVETVGTARDAVDGADIVVTATTSTSPVVFADWLAPGVTVISVGSFAPDRTEVDEGVLSRARAVVVDDAETATRQAGPIVQAALGIDDLVSLPDVVTGRETPRKAADDVIFYNSVGIGIQDAAAVQTIIELARERGTGDHIDL